MKYFFLASSLVWVLTFAKLKISHKLEKAIPTELEKLDSLKHLLKLVEEKKYNISIVVSRKEKVNDHILEISTALTYPYNNLSFTTPEIGKTEGEKFLEAASEEGLVAKVSISKETGWTNSDVTVTKAHRILTEVKDGRTGFTWNDKNHISHYTFFTPEDTTKIVYGHLEIKEVKSENLTESEVSRIKELLASAYFVYTSNDFGRALVAFLNYTFSGEKWQVVSDCGRNNFIKAKRMVELLFQERNYLIFAI